MKGIKKDYGTENMALFVHGAPAKHFEYLFKAFETKTMLSQPMHNVQDLVKQDSLLHLVQELVHQNQQICKTQNVLSL